MQRASFTDTVLAQEFSNEKPKYFKPSEKPGTNGIMRVSFLVDTDFPVKLVYNLYDKNSEDKNNFRGTYCSLTADSGVSSREIRTLLREGDTAKKLKIDVTTIKKAPAVATILPTLKYVIDSSGKPDLDAFKNGIFDVGFIWVSDAKYKAIQDEMKFFSGDGKALSDVDFIITSKEGALTWGFRADDKSLYGKNKKNEALKKKIESKLSAEYSRLGVKNIDEMVGSFLGITLSEEQWVQKLNEFGYLDSPTPAPAAKSAVAVTEKSESVPSDFDSDLDFSDIEE